MIERENLRAAKVVAIVMLVGVLCVAAYVVVGMIGGRIHSSHADARQHRPS